jgi:hypothetical protein
MNFLYTYIENEYKYSLLICKYIKSFEDILSYIPALSKNTSLIIFSYSSDFNIVENKAAIVFGNSSLKIAYSVFFSISAYMETDISIIIP